MSEKRRIARRGFFRRSAGLGLAALGAPAVGSGKGAKGRVGIGVIGCGARGTELIQELVKDGSKGAVVAVCDIYQPRREAAAALAKAGATADCRAVLGRSDVDAVVVATPDHLHGGMALDALEAGKDVYVETPLALRWTEARRVADAARRTGRVVQVGATSCADDKWRQVRDAIAKGAIGPLLWSQSCHAANSRANPWNRPIDPKFKPRQLDWAAFLGPAKKRPLDPERFFRWQKFWDYSGGLATAALYERLAHLLVAVGPALPVRVSAAGSLRVFTDQETPDNFHAVVHYPNEHTVVLMATCGSTQGVPEVIRGYEGTVHISDSGARILVQKIHKGKHPAEVRIRSGKRPGLMANFLECVRSGGRPDCGPEVGYPAAVGIDLALTAFRTGEMVHFDPKAQEEKK